MNLRTGWGVLLSFFVVACNPMIEELENPSSRFGEQGVTYKRAEEFGPNVLYPDSETALISVFLERSPVPIERHVRVCMRSMDQGAYNDPKTDTSDFEIQPLASCALQTGGWEAIPFTQDTIGMGEPRKGPAFSAEEHWIYSYSDPGDQTQPLLTKFDNIKLMHVRIKLSGLKGGSAYELRIVAGERLFTNRLVLRPPLPRRASEDAPAVHFLALADLKTWDRNDVQLKVRDQVARLFEAGRADLAILPGDISNQAGSSAHYANTYFRTYRGLLSQIPFYPIHGNHDLFRLELFGDVSQDGWHFFRMFQLPANPVAESVLHRGLDDRINQSGYRAFYSFDWGRVHFIALDVPEYESPGFDEFGKGSVQYNWLERDLDKSQSAAWRVVYFHNPVGNPDQRTQAMQELVDLMYRKNVSIVVSGHWETPVLSLDQPGTPPWMVVPSGGSRSRFYAQCPDKFGLAAFSATEDHLTGSFINADGATTGEFQLLRSRRGDPLSARRPMVEPSRRWRGCEE